MANPPFEIFVAPAEVYVAPVGEPFPAIGATPAGNWSLVGTLGADNISEEGITLRRTVTANLIRTLGSTVSRKVAISAGGFQVEFIVYDMNMEFQALALGGSVDDVDINATDSTFALPDEIQPPSQALLVRTNQSPAGDLLNTQWEIYAAVQTGSAQMTFVKTGAVGQQHLWECIKTSEGFVVCRTATGLTST